MLLCLQYEAIDLYLSLNAEENDDDMHVYLLEAAISYLNQHFKTNLRVNYNYRAQECLDDAAEIEKVLDRTARERTVSSQKASMAAFKMAPIMKVLTHRHHGNSRELKCPKEHGPICYCPPQLVFRARFFGSNIYAIFTVPEKVKCFLCDKEIEAGTFGAHFEKHCQIFNPSLMSVNPFAA